MSTSHGSSPRERSITANAQCSGRWPGVWIVRMTTSPSSISVPSSSGSCGNAAPAAAWIAHRHAVLEREPPVARDVVGVRVRLEHADEPDVVALARIQILLDRVGGIDDDGDACVLVTDEVRAAAEVVVDELLEEHGTDASNRCGYIS